VRCTLLHGFAGDPSAWDGVITAWRARIAPDPVALPGHGGGWVRDDWDANVAQLADAVAARDIVVGYSLGARLALGLVALGACEHAVLVSVNPGLPADAHAERAARRAGDATWAALLRTQGIATFTDAWQAQPLFATQAERVDPAVLAARRTRRLAHDPEQLARALEQMGLAEMPDYRAALAAAEGRVTLVVGADDAKFVALARGSGLPFATIWNSGHDPTLEQPRELARVLAKVIG
jgi:2-succinyl-6-hydroxy-2,4-cyclohexadiene-1-carboxylate synthase